MNYIAPLGKNIADVASYFTSKEAHDTMVSHKEMLKLASVLNNSRVDHHLIDLPKLVVVGTQSSGKSSLLNSLMGMDVLPVGKSMTTRTPLHLDLIQTSSEARIEFGTYEQLQWTVAKKIVITYPTLTNDQRDAVKQEIELQTNLKAGVELNISHEPIFMKIYAAGIPNLSFIDLPGLTSIAMTDRGQPKDIKDQIIQLVSDTIQSKHTLILAIIAARPDIEADMAMEIVKRADPQGERTIGILTKLDLMNEDADIGAYLENRLSVDLTLKYGYYGIKNRSNPAQTIPEALLAEKQYFQSHPVYRHDKYKSRLGMTTVAHHVSAILVHAIKCSLPQVLSHITKQLDKITEELVVMGTSVPPEKEIRYMTLNGLVSSYVKTFGQAIASRGSLYQTGRLIKDRFVQFRKTIASYNPFSEWKDQELLDRLKGYDGMRMSFPYVPLEIIETCLTDRTLQPLGKLVEPSQHCLQECVDLLQQLLYDMMDQPALKKYPHLIKSLRTVIVNDIFVPCYQTALVRVKELIKSEEAYIWTDHPEFHRVMRSDFSTIINATGEYDIAKLKHVLHEYYKTVVQTLSDSMPKCIVYHLIQSVTHQVNVILFEKIVGGDVNVLLEEFPEIEQRRKELEQGKKELQDIKKRIELVL